MELPELSAGDILVVHASGVLSPFDRKRIAEELKAQGVENTVMVMQAEPRYEVIKGSK